MYSLAISHLETQPFPYHDTIMDMGYRYLYEMAFTSCECALRTGRLGYTAAPLYISVGPSKLSAPVASPVSLPTTAN